MRDVHASFAASCAEGAPPRISPPCLSCGAQEATAWTTSTDAEYKTTTDRFTFYKCGNCGVLFLDPVPFDRLSEIYPPNYYAYSPPNQSIVTRVKTWLDARFFEKVLRRVPGDELRALDVGGGAGWELDVMRSADSRVRSTDVVDLDSGAEKAARAKGHGFYCTRVEDFVPSASYDIVLLLNLIEHVSDPVGVLTKVREMLSPQGIAVIKTPNYDSLDERLFRRQNWGGYHCPRHWVLFTKESFGVAARRAGLKVLSGKYTQGAPFWSASILQWLDSKGLVQITRERPVAYHSGYAILNAAFAAVDFARMPFSRTSQMFFVLSRADG